MEGVAVDVGDETDLAPLPRAAEGLDRQARPQSLPPMPTCNTEEKSAVWSMRRTKSAMREYSHTESWSCPSGCSRVRPARSAVCQAGLPSVQLTGPPANNACRAASSPRARSRAAAAVSSAADCRCMVRSTHRPAASITFSAAASSAAPRAACANACHSGLAARLSTSVPARASLAKFAFPIA